jgi:GH43 family beta-xylosidase
VSYPSCPAVHVPHQPLTPPPRHPTTSSAPTYGVTTIQTYETVFTTYCPEATTFTHQEKTYTITAATTLTIPATYTTKVPATSSTWSVTGCGVCVCAAIGHTTR